jgi:hypothetical protein
MNGKMMRQKRLVSSGRPDRTAVPATPEPTIHIAAPDDIRDYVLVREDEESAEQYEQRKHLFDNLLKLGGR